MEPGGLRGTQLVWRVVQLPAETGSAGRDLVMNCLFLPASWVRVVKFLPSLPGLSSIEPWDLHPQFDLMLPRTTVTDLRKRDVWGIEAFLSPSTVGLPYSPGSLRSLALRILGRFDDRETVVSWLLNLAVILEEKGQGSTFERSLIEQLPLPAWVINRTLLEHGPRSPFLHPACLRWLAAEIAAAPPWPFGIPPLGNGGRRAELDLTPRVWHLEEHRQIPFSIPYALLAVFLAHESFSLGPNEVAELRDWALATVTAHAFGIRLFSNPEDRVWRALEMWEKPDTHPIVPPDAGRPSDLRKAFKRVTGMNVGDFLAIAGILIMELRERISGNDAAAVFRRLLAQSDWPQFLDVVRQYLSSDLAGSRTSFRSSVQRWASGSYRGLGSIPTFLPTLQNSPLLEVGDALLPLGMDILADALATFPERVVGSLAGVSRFRTKLGHLFAAYVRDATDIVAQRHRIIEEKHISAVLSGKSPDLALVNGQDILFIEIANKRLSPAVAAGDPQQIKKKLTEYVDKAEQALAATRQRHVLASSLGAPTGGSVSYLVVLGESIPLTPPVLPHLRGLPPFFCSIDEYELLLELGAIGWSIPALVASWQRQHPPTMLGHYLGRITAITHPRGFRSDRRVRDLARRFGIPDSPASR